MVELIDGDGSGGTGTIEQRTPSNHELINSDQEKMIPKMKKELSKKELKEEERGKLKDIKDNIGITKDIQCGIGCIRGKLLQKFANQEMFAILYGILGATIAASSSYFSGTLSTMEKRFRIPSRNIGIILTGNDITALLFGIIITYLVGRGHKPRWIFVGMLFIMSFCVLTALPHLLYGSGTESLALTEEYRTLHAVALRNATDTSLCTGEGPSCIKEGSLTPQIIFFVAQLMWGIGSPLYGNLGMAYMDDNMKRSKTPLLMSFSFFIRMLGPVAGYGLASYCLKMFISPELTPSITPSDPRWLGAWWLGWILIAAVMGLFAILVALFPKELPDSAVRKILSNQDKDEKTKKEEEDASNVSWHDMKVTFGRLFRNKVLMCTTAASCFYVFGYYPYWTFMPKYIEIQYRVSASFAALITGVVGLIFTAMGILIAGAFITKVRPRARPLAAFNMFAGIVAMLGIISYNFLGCAEGDAYNLSVGEANKHMTACNSDCNCEFSTYAPICSMDGTNTTFITPCHAGCRSSVSMNGTKIYHDCSCITNTTSYHPYSPPKLSNLGGSAKQGGCTIDCSTQFYMFLGVVCLLKFVGAAAKTTNVLLSVRCVEEKDKAVSMSLGMTALSLFGFIPAPMVFGWLMDQTCILWGKTCSGTGSCWVYDSAQLRTLLHSTTVCLIGISNLFDVAVWYYCKDIQIFDEEVGEDKKNSDKKKAEDKEKESGNKGN